MSSADSNNAFDDNGNGDEDWRFGEVKTVFPEDDPDESYEDATERQYGGM
jgi:hypothetical protein